MLLMLSGSRRCGGRLVRRGDGVVAGPRSAVRRADDPVRIRAMASDGTRSADCAAVRTCPPCRVALAAR